MNNKRNKNCIAILVLILILFTSCGNDSKPDGIDSVIILSEIEKEENNPPAEEEKDSITDDLEQIMKAPAALFHGYSFSSSLYLLFVRDALDSIASRYNTDRSSAVEYDVMLEDGTVLSAEEYCRYYADTEFSWACLLIASVLETGHELNECRSYEAASRQAYSMYQANPALYSEDRIPLNDLILHCLYPALYEDLFFMKYGPDGECKIDTGILEEMMERNVRKIRYTYLPFYDDQTQERFSESEIRNLTDMSENYLDRFKNGEPFEDIFAENALYLDAFHIIMDPENSDIYYSLYDPDLPTDIIETAEKLEPFEAVLLVTDDYTSVIQRLPVNEKEDGMWYDWALSIAFDSTYGDEYAEQMTIAYDTADILFDETIRSQLTAHFIP